MSNWRDRILSEFMPGVARLTLVADPEGLVVEEGMLAAVRERGFELIPFEDPIAFRYAYESRFRASSDQDDSPNLVVVSCSTDLDSLPFDLRGTGRRLSFRLGALFPNLSQSVLSALSAADLDALYDAQRLHGPERQLGDNATKEFVLRHVFRVAPELIVSPVDLLRVLLRRHFTATRIPRTLDTRLIQIVRRRSEFADWPLEAIVPDRQAFLAFLQERWPACLDRSALQTNGGDRPDASLAYAGPVDLPFEHDDVRVYMDNLFLEGHLDAVEHRCAELLSKTWLAVGIRMDAYADRARRLDGLLDAAARAVPEEDARHEDWFRFATTWAELNALRLDPERQSQADDPKQFEILQAQVDEAFSAWVDKRYAGLANLPPVPPVMLHHVPRLLARYLGEGRENKAALLLIDGLSLDQWIVVRKELARHRRFRFQESAVFAWVPTVTSVSRQSAFAGRAPYYFPRSIHVTSQEPVLWRRFWSDEGIVNHRVIYRRGLGDGNLDGLQELIEGPTIRVAGLVVDKVDKIMHGMELGAVGMHNQVRQWAGEGYLAKLLDLLLDRDFAVYLTSDHGNIEAFGCGRPAEGVLADSRGERVRVYRNAQLRRPVHERFPGTQEWLPAGLPQDYLPLLAADRSAFIRENERVVCHGGACIEEVIVPLVRIEKSQP